MQRDDEYYREYMISANGAGGPSITDGGIIRHVIAEKYAFFAAKILTAQVGLARMVKDPCK